MKRKNHRPRRSSNLVCIQYNSRGKPTDDDYARVHWATARLAIHNKAARYVPKGEFKAAVKRLHGE